MRRMLSAIYKRNTEIAANQMLAEKALSVNVSHDDPSVSSKERPKEYAFNYQPPKRHKMLSSLHDFDIIFGPATACECLSTSGFEYAYMNDYKDAAERKTKIFVGGSFGAYRLTALAGSIIMKTDLVKLFYEHIIDMTYKKDSTPEALGVMLKDLRSKVAGNAVQHAILENEEFELVVWVARLKPVYRWLHKYVNFCVLGSFGLMNIISRRILKAAVFDRLCFYSGKTAPDLFPAKYVSEFHKITTENFEAVLQATSCIPGITEPVNEIPGCGAGMFLDAAVCDYNIGFRVNDRFKGLVVNQYEKLNRTYFDKAIKFRSVPEDFFDNTALIYPTDHFVNRIQLKRLPSLNEWFEDCFVEDPKKRMEYWGKVHELSKLYLCEDIKMQMNAVPARNKQVEE